MKPEDIILQQLTLARRVADHACELGIQHIRPSARPEAEHLGAVLADAVLQAGVSYRTVVRGRIERIRKEFPDASTMSGLIAHIERGQAADLLLWKHPLKIVRFVILTKSLANQGIETIADLRSWLRSEGARQHLLSLHGVGPKTFDYLCALVGLDFVAVDRHIRTFASEAGVALTDYDDLKVVMSCAADLLGIARRDFDAWVWHTISERSAVRRQLSMI